MQQVLLDLGGDYYLSIVQGKGVMGSRFLGTVEVALVTQDEVGNVVLRQDEPWGHLDAKDLASYILTYLQDKAEGALHD